LEYAQDGWAYIFAEREESGDLVTTSRNARADVLVALKEGATDFIVKPFGPATLSEKIAKALQAIE